MKWESIINLSDVSSFRVSQPPAGTMRERERSFANRGHSSFVGVILRRILRIHTRYVHNLFFVEIRVINVERYAKYCRMADARVLVLRTININSTWGSFLSVRLIERGFYRLILADVPPQRPTPLYLGKRDFWIFPALFLLNCSNMSFVPTKGIVKQWKKNMQSK